MKRRIFTIFCLFLLVVGVLGSAAGCQQEPVDKSGHPLGIYDGDQLVAEIGMTREAVEAVLGEGAPVGSGEQVNYEGLILIYRDGILCSIDVTSAKYSDNMGVKVGTFFSDIIPLYDEQELTYGVQQYSLNIGFDENKQILLDPVEDGYALYHNEEVAYAKEYQRNESNDSAAEPTPTFNSTEQDRKTQSELQEEAQAQQQADSQYENYIAQNPQAQAVNEILIRDRGAIYGEF